jgi:hypothetical protein
MSAFEDGWSLDSESTPATPDPVEAERQRLSDLLREAMLILDGVAPDEVPLSGEGWSLIGPVTSEPAPSEQVSPPPQEVPAAVHHDNVVAFPAPEQSQQDPLSSAIHDALEEAIAEGWALTDDEAPGETLELSTEEQAFFDAGDEFANMRVTGPAARLDPEPERPDGFWVRFWRKTA